MDFDFTTESLIPENTGTITISGTGAIQVPIGTTAQRPTGAGLPAALRFNTDLSQLEFYNTLTSTWQISANAQSNALSSLTGTGLVVQTGTSTFTNRSIAGTTNQITITNGDGVSGNPTAAIPNTFITPQYSGGSYAAYSAAGATQGTATAITVRYARATTVAVGTGVILPTPVTGQVHWITNDGANPLNVYPAVGGSIDGLATNAPIVVPVSETVALQAISTTAWNSISDAHAAGTGISITHTAGTNTITNTGVTSIAGTANQITASAATGAVTLSIPSTFVAPGTIRATSWLYEAFTVGISAAGATQGTATALTTSYNVVTTVAAGTGVILPTPASPFGQIVVVLNRGANALNVYPNTGAAIANAATNAAISLPVNQEVTLFSVSATQWWVQEPIIVAGTNVTVTPGPGTLTIAASGGSGSPGGANTNVQYNNSGVFGGSNAFNFIAGANPRVDILGTSGTNQLRVGGSAFPADATIYMEAPTTATIDDFRAYFNSGSPASSGYITLSYDQNPPGTDAPYIRLYDADDDCPEIRFQTGGTLAAPTIDNRFGGRGGVATATTGFKWTVNGTEIMSADTNFLDLPTGTTAARPGTPVSGMVRYNTTTTRFEGYENGAWAERMTCWWDVIFPGVISPTTATNQNDYNPTGLANAYEIRWNGTASIKLTGLAGGRDGRRILICNDTTDYLLWLENENTASTAANRFDLPRGFPVFLMPGDTIELRYNSTKSRWQPVGWTARGVMGLTIFTDFAEGTLGPLTSTVSGSGASAQVGSYLVNTTERPLGVTQIDSGTTTTGRSTLGFAGTAAIVPTLGPALSVARLAVETTVTGTETFQVFSGFIDCAGGTPTDGVCWNNRWNGAAAEWSQDRFAAGAATRTTTGSPTPDNNYIWLVVFVNATWTRADFIYSTDSVNFTVASSPTTGFPNNTQYTGWIPRSIIKSVGTSQRNVSIDLAGYRVDYSSRG